METLDPALGEVALEPVTNLVAKRLLLGSQREVHTPSCTFGDGGSLSVTERLFSA